MTYVSFPGLGIEPFHIDKIALNIFDRIHVAWYGILITIGMILAVLLSVRLAKREGIKEDDIVDFAFIVILAGVLGARAYYVIFTWNQYHYLVTSGSFFYNLWHTFVNCIAVWQGGLAIYGGILAGLLTGFLFAKKRKIPMLKIYDILVPCVLIGQTIGRWGNFINVEAYGTETTLPWRMGILEYSATLMENGKPILLSETYVHPTFLYESLWNCVALVLVLALLYPRKKFDGEMFCFYLIWYGFGRMLIEGLRTDSLMLGSLRVSQLVGAVSLVLGVTFLLTFLRRAKNKAEPEYQKVYEKGDPESAAEPAPTDGEEPDQSDEHNETEAKETEGHGEDH